MIEAIADSGDGMEGLSVVTQSDLEHDDDINLDDVDIDIMFEITLCHDAESFHTIS